MSWEYRVVRDTETTEFGPYKEVVHSYAIEKTHPNQEYRFDNLRVECESHADLLDGVRAMQQALTKPVLAWQDGRFVEVEEAIVKSVGEIDKQEAIGK